MSTERSINNGWGRKRKLRGKGSSSEKLSTTMPLGRVIHLSEALHQLILFSSQSGGITVAHWKVNLAAVTPECGRMCREPSREQPVTQKRWSCRECVRGKGKECTGWTKLREHGYTQGQRGRESNMGQALQRSWMEHYEGPRCSVSAQVTGAVERNAGS